MNPLLGSRFCVKGHIASLQTNIIHVNYLKFCPACERSMSLKQNLLKKIEINTLTRKVLNSVGPVGSLKKVDKTAMTRLLDMADYQEKKERDLTLFYKEDISGKLSILVLDNELPLYLTTIDDVVMRKSPTIKEIISIRNAIKIVNDSDVVLSRREQSVEAIQKECTGKLDLSFTGSDLDEIERDGVIALKASESDGVIQSLSLFAELLGFHLPPENFRTDDLFVLGARRSDGDRSIPFGPAVVYDTNKNDLKLFENPYPATGAQEKAPIYPVLTGNEKASRQGADVFQYLKESIKEQ